MTHRVKTAALVAYAEDLLSPRGRARLERHLAVCTTCQRELSAILLYERIAEDARVAPPPELRFDRMERALADEAERISMEIVRAKRRPTWAWAGVALAAAALLAIYVGWPSTEPRTAEAPPPAPEEPSATEVPVAPLVESPALAPVVTLIAGRVEVIDEAGTAQAVGAGAALAEGARVRTHADGILHARLSDGTGFVVAADSEVRLVRAREDAVTLEVARGRVDSAVAPLRGGSSYVVLGAGHRVEVRGTRFAVSVEDTSLGVELAEGAVDIETPVGEHIALRAPARWSSESESPEGTATVSAPRELTLGEGTLAPVTLAHPDLVRWEVEGTELAAPSAELLMRPGDHEVRGWDTRGRLFTAFLAVGVDPVALEPSALTPGPPRVRPGHLAPEEITRVLERGRRQLATCYERSLRLHPEVQGRVRLRVTVGAAGDVRRVSVVGADRTATTELHDCVATHAQRWAFPPPGGPVTFEVPLAFSARGL